MLVDCCLYMYDGWFSSRMRFSRFYMFVDCYRPSGSDEIWNSNDRVDIFPTIDFEINLDHKMDNPIFFKIVFLTLVIFDLCYLGFLSNKPQSERSSSMIDIYNGFIQTIWQKVFYNSAYDMTMYWKIKSTILSKMSSYFSRK